MTNGRNGIESSPRGKRQSVRFSPLATAALALPLVLSLRGGRLPLQVGDCIGAAAGERDNVVLGETRTSAGCPPRRRARVQPLKLSRHRPYRCSVAEAAVGASAKAAKHVNTAMPINLISANSETIRHSLLRAKSFLMSRADPGSHEPDAVRDQGRNAPYPDPQWRCSRRAAGRLRVLRQHLRPSGAAAVRRCEDATATPRSDSYLPRRRLQL
jgi:hypothetical protein